MAPHFARWTLDLPPGPEAPGLAREFLRRSLCPEHAQAVLDDAVLLTSEAVSNAVEHGGPPIRLGVACRETSMEVRVSDASSRPPVEGDAELLAEGGRGVQLIDLLSEDWGVEQHPDDGKDVWFVLASR